MFIIYENIFFLFPDGSASESHLPMLKSRMRGKKLELFFKLFVHSVRPDLRLSSVFSFT